MQIERFRFVAEMLGITALGRFFDIRSLPAETDAGHEHGST